MTHTLSTLIASGLLLVGCSGSVQDSGDSSVEPDTTASSNAAGAHNMPATVSPPEGTAPTPDKVQGPDTSSADEECGADKIAEFVSQEATIEVRTELASKLGHERIRWLTPDSVITMDLQADRLNVMLDEDGIITGATCQ